MRVFMPVEALGAKENAVLHREFCGAAVARDNRTHRTGGVLPLLLRGRWDFYPLAFRAKSV